ncbi:hypothetical protein L1049_002216 [Liquidambar formosana]|uniref:Laccase n=1 Tax=Liquidambar formosana TaxID=63359 RepID=A0AAP0NGQ7_LIQFO
MGFKMGTTSEFVGCLFLSGMLLCMAQGNVHYYEFVLRESNFTRLCETKSMLTVNDSFPGPVIRVNKGDTAYVTVHNQGYYGVTIHWHGVKQPRNPWSDGPVYITQCPIKPGSSFTYEVIFSVEEGTIWWHAHSDWTRATVHGAIVVYPTVGTTYPFPEPDGEEVIVLGSWYTGDLYEMEFEYLSTGEIAPASDAYTINGQPGDLCKCSSESTYRRLVDYGKTYILRVVNAVMNVEMFFAIAEHNLTVVAIDGAYVKPIVTSYILIIPGQTMDILVTMDRPLGHYYMATRQFDNVDKLPTFDRVNATAIIEYRGNYTPPATPTFPSILPSYEDSDAAKSFTVRIKSLADIEHPVDVPINITTRMLITSAANTIIYPDGVSSLASSLSNISWANPSTDILLAYYRNISGVYTPDFPDWPLYFFNFTGPVVESDEITSKGTKVKMLNYNEQVEVVFQGTTVFDSPEDHPIHFHGHSFYVVGSGEGNYDNVTDPPHFNLVDPPYVSTVTIPLSGWVAIRFVANNPGVWFWHCHMEKHLIWGMSTVFIVKNGGTPETSIRDPPPNLPTCSGFTTRIQRLGEVNKSNMI